MKLPNHITKIVVLFTIYLTTGIFIFSQNKITTFPYTESFESGLGDWVQSTDDDIDWTRHSGTTGSVGTGPNGAYDSTYYIYTEASALFNMNAYLDASFDFSGLTSPGLGFHYHMYGGTMGTLSIDVWDGSWNLDEFTLTGQQHTSEADPWSQAYVDLSAYAGSDSVVIRFRGLTGNSYESDMCVDHIIVDDNLADMVITSVICMQPDTSIMMQGSLNNPILLIEVVTEGFLNPFVIDSFNILPTGSDDPTADISLVSVYYTGPDTLFNSSNLFGSADISDSRIIGNQKLSEGKNYFWVAYNITDTATAENIIDAECSAVYFDIPFTYVPTVRDPVGNRKIAPAMTFSSSTCSHTNTSVVMQGSLNNNILSIEITVNGLSDIISIDSLNILPTGTDDFTTDVDSVLIYYTGTNSNFAAINLFGSTKILDKPIAGNQALTDGNNYFWVAYNITDTAIAENIVDAECDAIYLDDLSTHVPTVTNPSGNRMINYSMSVDTISCSSINGDIEVDTDSVPVLGINIVVENTSLPILNIESFTIDSGGSSNLTKDVSRIRIFSTGASNTFDTGNQLWDGDNISSPAPVSYDLSIGDNYFWITYDISNNAIIGDILDAACSSIKINGADYIPAEGNPAGYRKIKLPDRFLTFMEADLVIGQPDFTSQLTTTNDIVMVGASSSAVSSKGVLVVGSQSRGGAYIWYELPDTNGTPADVVVGNPDFYTNQDGTTASLMNNVESVCFSPDGNKLIASDGSNNRVLIWNSIPTTNGQPADVVIGQTDFNTGTFGIGPDKFYYPWSVFVTPDGKLIIGDRNNNRVLIYNKIPTENGASADLVIGQPDFYTTTFGATSSIMSDVTTATTSPDGKLLVNNEALHRVLIFNDFPTENGVAADVVIGQTDFTSSSEGLSDSKFYFPVGSSVSPTGELAICDFGNNRVLIFNAIPSENGASADIVLGQPDFTTNTPFNGGISARSMYHPYSVNYDLNGRLYIPGRDMHRVMMFGKPSVYTADLGVTIVPNEYLLNVGDSISYLVTLVNNGPNQSSNIKVQAAMPALFSLETYVPEVGEYFPFGGYWMIPHLDENDTVTLKLKGIVTDGGDNVSAFAAIIASDANDNNYSNNAASIDVSVQNEPPVISGFAPDTIEANTSTEWIPFTIGDPDTDPAELELIAISSDPDIVDVSQVVFNGDNESRYVKVTPITDSSGTVFITIQVTDGYSTSESNLLLHVLSTNTYLSDLQVDGATITGFDPVQRAYSYKLSPGTVIVPTITATAQDAISTVDIYATDTLPGITSINVTAENGSIGTYYVSFSDSIPAASDSTLSDLRVDGVTVEGFSPFILEYSQILPYGTVVVPTVIATASDAGATVDIIKTASLPGRDSAVVTASNGTSVQIYTIDYIIDSPDDNANLLELYVDGELVVPFDPDSIFFSFEYPYGTVAPPVVSGFAEDVNATLVVTQATEMPDSAFVEITAEDGVTTKLYTIEFTLASPSSDATLKKIRVNGSSIFGFKPDILTYNILLENGESVPVVNAFANHDSATVVITDATFIPGTAEIEVTAQDGVSTLTYTVNFDFETLSSNALLSSLNLDNTLIDGFDPNVFSYDIELPFGTVDIPVTTCSTMDDNADYTIENAISLPGTTVVTVTAEDGVTTSVYNVNFTIALNTDATLKNLLVDGITVTGFDSSILVYNVELAEGTTIVPTVTAFTYDDNASAVVTDAPALPGTAIIDVTAEDGVTTLQYRINFSVAVPAGTDASLSDLQVDGVTIDEFASFVFDYEYPLPYGTTTIPVVTATTNDGLASAVITDAVTLPDTAFVNVTAQNPSYTSEYTVRFTIELPSDNANLSDLRVDDVTIDGFIADDTVYTYLLPYGETTVPVVTATAEHDSATIEIMNAVTIPDTTFVIVTAQDTLVTKTYQVIFVHNDPNNDAYLDSIIIDENPLTTFNRNVFEYNVELDEGTTIVPTVRVATRDTNATALITDAPALPGTTEIMVTAQDSVTKLSYIVNFSVKQPAGKDATLSGIWYDGTLVEGFSSNIYTYDIELPYGSTVPVVTASPTDASATVEINQITEFPGQATIDVTSLDGTNDTTYAVNFTVALNNDASLSDLQIDGTTVTGFNTDSLSYTVELPYGTSLVPIVTATPTDSNASFVINDASILPGKTTVVITAENGINIITYEVDFIYSPPSSDKSLSDLRVDGSTVTNFNPVTFNYNVELPFGTTKVPTVTATAADTNATVQITKASSLPGVTSILVTAQDGTSNVYTVNFILGGTLINQLSLEDAVELSPNPSDGIVTILIKLNTSRDAQVEVVDMIGRKVIIENLQGVNNTEFEINLTNSAKGMYLVKITINDQSIIKSLVIK